MSQTVEGGVNTSAILLRRRCYFISLLPPLNALTGFGKHSSASVGGDMTLQEQEELTELRLNRGLKPCFADLHLNSFWYATAEDFLNLPNKAILTLCFHKIPVR